MCDFLLTGWWSGNRAGLQESVLSLKSPPSTWVGPQFLQKSSKLLLCVSLQEEPGPCPQAARLFLSFNLFFIEV